MDLFVATAVRHAHRPRTRRVTIWRIRPRCRCCRALWPCPAYRQARQWLIDFANDVLTGRTS